MNKVPKMSESSLNIAKLKKLVIAEIDSRYDEFDDLSRKLHDSPEVAFEEKRACTWLTEYLGRNGFTVKKGICRLPTAFSAAYGSGRPAIAFLAEYDALPKIGHACGHNLIATSAVAAGIGTKKVVESLGGSVMVFGTPGEELYGGKAIMADRGAFTDIDMTMICHPGGGNRVFMRTLALVNLQVEFHGVAAHAGARPEAGVNALEAMLQSFNSINSLRQHIRSRDRVSGIITDGGEAANIVPAHSAASFFLRSENDRYLEELKRRVLNCFTGAATATGAKLEYKWGEHYAAMAANLTMARLFRRNLQSLGRSVALGEDTPMNFSTDVGNVSRLVPTIQPLIGIAAGNVLIHTPEFAAAAASEQGLRSLLDAARAMAMTAVDLLAVPENAEKVVEEFCKGR
jgi:amidohydrolase